MSTDGLKHISIGAVFRDSFELFKVYWKQAIAVSIIVAAISSISQILVDLKVYSSATPGLITWSFFVPQLITLFVVIIQAGFIWYIHKKQTSKKSPQTFTPFTARIPQLIVAYIIVVFIVTLGFFLLIIPGIFLSLIYSQVLYFVYLENKNVRESLDLSRSITYGNRWRIFLIGASMFVITLLPLVPVFMKLVSPYIEYIFMVLPGSYFVVVNYQLFKSLRTLHSSK